MGCPTVVCMDLELNRYILMNEGKGIVPGYPQSMLDILGECNIAAVNGSLHMAMRNVMLGLISPFMTKDHLLRGTRHHPDLEMFYILLQRDPIDKYCRLEILCCRLSVTNFSSSHSDIGTISANYVNLCNM